MPILPLRRRYARTLTVAVAVTALCLSIFAAGGQHATAQVDENEQIAHSLATLLRAARSVVSDSQALINDPIKGFKGFTGDVALDAARHNYQLATGVDLDDIDPASLHGELIRAEMEAITEIVDEAQERINRKGVGFKGFLPAIFAKLVADRFGQKKGELAQIRLTAPKEYVRNRQNLPDKWEHRMIEERFRTAEHPVGQPATHTGVSDGKQAFRLILPEYYKLSCLSCHGEPAGKRDITGGKKEGGQMGELGGAISVVIYL